LEHRPENNGEIEQQLRDPFNYNAEDRIIGEWEAFHNKIKDIPFNVEKFKYGYSDPRKPD
jgi:hypothetical protein